MATTHDQPITSARDAARVWLRPPRAHGEIDHSRVVSFLELFYDLVYVVLIAQIAHTLAGDVSWVGVRNFVIVFGLIWVAWLNGTLYHELHGRENGRGRTFIFAQMILLVLLSVYAAHAADDPDDGRGFAITFAVFLALLTWQWWEVRRLDDERYGPMTARYIITMLILLALMVASALVDDVDVRLVLWAVLLAAFIVPTALALVAPRLWVDGAFEVTESMVERFGLFTIIVLGEVVVGVADGLAEAERDARTIVTGALTLGIGFGIWWNYFDFTGRREPRPELRVRILYVLTHLPLTLGIAAAGAGMVSLIEHAADDRAPAPTAWLIGGSTALAAAALAVIVTTMPRNEGRRLVPVTLLGAGALALVLGALRPNPMVLSIAIYIALMAVWVESFIRHGRDGHLITDH